jgi:hypothetical protein
MRTPRHQCQEELGNQGLFLSFEDVCGSWLKAGAFELDRKPLRKLFYDNYFSPYVKNPTNSI